MASNTEEVTASLVREYLSRKVQIATPAAIVSLTYVCICIGTQGNVSSFRSGVTQNRAEVIIYTIVMNTFSIVVSFSISNRSALAKAAHIELLVKRSKVGRHVQ